MATVNALSVALFNAAAGGYSADMSKNPAAYAAAVGAVLEKDLSSDAAFVAHLLENFGVATTDAVYADAQAALTGMVAGLGRANATVGAIDFLADQTATSAYAAIATAFQAKVTAAAAFSAANASELDVSKLVAAVTGVDADVVAAAASFAAGAASRDTEVADLEVEVAALEEELAAAQAALAAAEEAAAAAAVTAAAELAAAQAAAAAAAETAAAEAAALQAEIDALENPAGGSFVLTTSTSDVLIGIGNGDAFSGATATDDATDIIVDATAGDADTLTLAVTATPAALTTINVETINITSTMVGGTTLTIDGANYRGVEELNITRGAVGSISGSGAVSVENLVGGRVAEVNVVSGVTSLVVEQQTLDGTVVNATAVTGAVTLHGAGTIVANSSTGTITLSDVDAGATALVAAGLDAASSITAALATSVQVGQGAGTLTGAVTIAAAAATDIDVTTTGAVTVTAGSAATASSNITINDVDASGATITSGLTGTSTITSTIVLEGTAASTDTATVSAKGAVAFDIDGTGGQDVDTLNLSGNGASVTYTFEAANDFSTINVTGTNSVTLVGDSDDFSGETVTDSTTAGTVTLKFNADSAADVDLSGVSVDVIDIDVANIDNILTLADNQTVLVSEDQGTDDLALTADEAGYTLTLNAGDDTADTSTATIVFGVATLTDFDTVSINATNGAISATSLDVSVATGTAAVTIAGTKAVTLGAIVTGGEIATIDASGLTGVFTATLEDTDLTSLYTGSAADVIVVNAALTATIDAGDGANNIDIDVAGNGLIVQTGSGADSVEIGDTESIVVSTGAGNDTVEITGVDTDAVIDAGDGTADTLDINGGVALDLSTGNTNFSFVNFEIVDITDVSETVTIAAADFANENTFELTGNSASADILLVTGTSSVNSIDASGVTITTALLKIDGGDGADTLIGSDDGTAFVISGLAHVDSGEVITGGEGTDSITYTGAAGSLDLSVATITGVESLATGDATAITLAQGTGITTLTGIAATETLTLEYLSTVFESSAEADAASVNIAGEWHFADGATDGTLTYFDESLSLVVAVTLTGMDSSTTAVVGGNLFITYA